MKERLEDVSELAVPNLAGNVSQLAAWHECQQIEPIFQWKLTEIFDSSPFLLKKINGRKLTQAFHKLTVF
jgi:hypothetical protein